MGRTWSEAEMAALSRTGWRPEASCGAKSKKKRKNNQIRYKKNKMMMHTFNLILSINAQLSYDAYHL